MREGLQKVAALDDTIVAISTPPGHSGLGVVRISGSQAASVVAIFFEPKAALTHRRASLGRWMDYDDEVVDDVVVTLFRSPHSYTGEDVIEISAHGNPLVLARIVEMVEDAGARRATAGEFTLRAVMNGKMDLLQAEAIRDFIDAQTERQARNAIRQVQGQVSKRIAPGKKILIDVIAHLEAGIDFAEDDVEIPGSLLLKQQIQSLADDFSRLQETFGYGRLLTTGLRLTIAGKPNVGKSSLFNRLVSADRAIVTDIPGTTRDVLTEMVTLDGIPLRCADTAGIRPTVDRVESIGVERSFDALAEADLVLVVVDGSRPLDSDDESVLKATEGLRRLIVVNKADLPNGFVGSVEFAAISVGVSAKTGAGLEELKEAIHSCLLSRQVEDNDECVLTSTRQNEVLIRSIGALVNAQRAVVADTPHEMVLLDLYEALGALNELTGETTNEDILDRVFSTFCVGK